VTFFCSGTSLCGDVRPAPSEVADFFLLLRFSTQGTSSTYCGYEDFAIVRIYGLPLNHNLSTAIFLGALGAMLLLNLIMYVGLLQGSYNQVAQKLMLVVVNKGNRPKKTGGSFSASQISIDSGGSQGSRSNMSDAS